jgi:hypothetical protein
MLGFTGNWTKKALMKKALILRETLLSAGHQMAKELAPHIELMFELFRKAAQTGDVTEIQAFMDTHPNRDDVHRLLWEPSEVYGWEIKATFYRKDGKLVRGLSS